MKRLTSSFKSKPPTPTSEGQADSALNQAAFMPSPAASPLAHTSPGMIRQHTNDLDEASVDQHSHFSSALSGQQCVTAMEDLELLSRESSGEVQSTLKPGIRTAHTSPSPHITPTSLLAEMELTVQEAEEEASTPEDMCPPPSAVPSLVAEDCHPGQDAGYSAISSQGLDAPQDANEIMRIALEAAEAVVLSCLNDEASDAPDMQASEDTLPRSTEFAMDCEEGAEVDGAAAFGQQTVMVDESWQAAAGHGVEAGEAVQLATKVEPLSKASEEYSAEILDMDMVDQLAPLPVASSPLLDAQLLLQCQAADEAEMQRLAAEEAEVQRLAAEQEEMQRLAAEEAEMQRLAVEEAEMQRLAVEEAEVQRLAVEMQRLAAEEAEVQRLAVEEAEMQRLAVEEAEIQRLAAEEVEMQRLAEEEAQMQRLAVEEVEMQRIASEQVEMQRLAAEEAEMQRLAAEEAEMQRIAAEEAEVQRIAAEEVEMLRLAAEEAEVQRLAAEEVELQRLAAEEAEVQRLAAEEAEMQRLASEQEEMQRLAAEEAEMQRLASEQDEMQRLAAEEAEMQRLAVEEVEIQRLAAEEVEMQRLAAEEAEMQRLAVEEVEMQRLASEEVEMQRLAAEQVEMQRMELQRLAAEEAVLQAELQRLTDEQVELQRLAAEQAGMQRQTAEPQVDEEISRLQPTAVVPAVEAEQLTPDADQVVYATPAEVSQGDGLKNLAGEHNVIQYSRCILV